MSGREKKRQHLTVILGAGASIPNGGPTADYLTRRVREDLPFNYYPRTADFTKDPDLPLSDRVGTVAVPELVESALAACFEKPDFELTLDALEQLQAVAPSYQGGPLIDEQRATLTAFLRPKPESADLFDPIPVRHAHQDAIHLINVIVEECTVDPTPMEKGVDVRQVLEELAGQYTMTVISLNYDNVADDAHVEWFDGYTRDVGGMFRSFEPDDWLRRDPDAHVLMHLHGSIRWGYHGDFAYSALYEPVKFNAPALARESIARGMSATDTVRGHFYGSTPIISGLSKGGKMVYNVRPYGYYFQEAMQSLIREPRLLIVGYGGRDAHLNELLYEYVRVHDSRRRPIVMTKIPGSDVLEVTPLRTVLERLAGRHALRSILFAYDRVHIDYPDAPRLQTHGRLLLIPAGLPLPADEDLSKFRSFWES